MAEYVVYWEDDLWKKHKTKIRARDIREAVKKIESTRKSHMTTWAVYDINKKVKK